MTQQHEHLSDNEVSANQVAPPEPPAGPPPTSGGASEPGDSDAGSGPGAALRGRIKPLGRRSLTARIVAGVVVLVFLLVGAIGAGTYFALRSYLSGRLDQQLQSTAVQNAAYIAGCLPIDGQLHCKGSPGTQLEWIAIVSTPGPRAQPLSSQYIRPLTLDSDQVRTLVRGASVLSVEEDGYSLRVMAAQAPTGGPIVLTGIATDDLRRTMGRLVVLEILIGGAALVLAVLATTYGVQFSLRGLRRVSTTAQDVAAELSPDGAGLDRRVPVTEEGTEVAQLAESMNTLLGAVETQFAARIESEERMRQFLADASHELRTPLTSIRGYAELARMQRAVGEHADDNLSRIESEGTRMSRLVEDLLMLARGDTDTSHAEPELVVIADLLDDAVVGARASFPDRPIDVEVIDTPHVIGDRDQLLRVVRNLVTNAAVHTAEGRPILVRSRDDDEGVLIQVVDGGPGLPPEHAAHVFERFWRADKARTRARGGSGLGLAIVAAIVRTHGGGVYFDSSVDGGSTVSVWLPGVEPT